MIYVAPEHEIIEIPYFVPDEPSVKTGGIVCDNIKLPYTSGILPPRLVLSGGFICNPGGIG